MKSYGTPIVAFFMGLLLASVHHPFTKYFPAGGGAFQRQSSR